MEPVVLDCRWLGHGGVGRVTEHLLRGLDQGERRLDWHLWGPSRMERLSSRFPMFRDESDPRRSGGQRRALRLPRSGGPLVFMHQTRPLLAGRCITVMHDTTQLRTTSSAAVRFARRAFLRRVARSSLGVITVSEWSRDRICADLGVARSSIRVVGNAADDDFGERIRALRSTSERQEMVLYVGSFSPHKNLSRLVAAFERSTLGARGVELVLVGGLPTEAAALRARAGRARVTVIEHCPQETLDRLFASTRFLVQPSLEEGFGLPVWEAMAAGIPVCSSTGGALAEVARGAVATFDPLHTDSIAWALDEAMSRAREMTTADEEASSAAFFDRVPTPAQYAENFEAAVIGFLA